MLCAASLTPKAVSYELLINAGVQKESGGGGARLDVSGEMKGVGGDFGGGSKYRCGWVQEGMGGEDPRFHEECMKLWPAYLTSCG